MNNSNGNCVPFELYLINSYVQHSRVSVFYLPTGVAGPSLSLTTISVCPSMRNRGGWFLAKQEHTRQLNATNTKLSDICLNRTRLEESKILFVASDVVLLSSPLFFSPLFRIILPYTLTLSMTRVMSQYFSSNR